MKDELSRLQAGAAALGLALDDEIALRLIDYLDELYRWNRVQRLTAIPREQAVEAQLLDSLALVDCLSGCRDIVDLGSGAGLPGVPLAVVLPGVRVTLVEKRRKRAGFLEQVIGQIGGESFAPVAARIIDIHRVPPPIMQDLVRIG